MRAAIYCRISLDRTGEALGVARQEADCRTLADREGWTVEAVHTDNDISAFSGRERPGYQALIDDVSSGRVDAILAWHPDRLHRSVKELEAFIDLVEASDVEVRTVTTGQVDLSTPSGRLTARVAASVARHESEQKSARVRRKMVELAEAGRPTGGSRSFGYDFSKQQVIPEEAELVREAAERALTGESLTSIARDWNSRGVATVRGANGWTYQALRRMLLAPRMAGLSTYKGEVVGKAQWPAILDEDTHRRLVVALRSKPDHGSRVRKHLLTGLVSCGRCGARLYAKTSSGRYATSVYRCVKVPGRGQLTACGSLSVVTRSVDELVAGWVLAALDDGRFGRSVGASTGQADRRQEAVEQLSAAESRLEGLAQEFASGGLTRGEWKAARQVLVDRVAGLRRTVEALTGNAALAALPTTSEARRRWWDEAAVSARRAVVDGLVERVTVAPKGRRGGNRFDPSRVTVDWLSD